MLRLEILDCSNGYKHASNERHWQR